MNLHALLLHLVEIEQLIDEQEQTLGVTVDNRKRLRDSLTIRKFSGNQFPMLFQTLQRSDNKRYRRTDFMGNHREELQAGVSHLLILLALQLVEFFLMAALLTLQPALCEPIDCVTDEQKIQNLGWQRPPERRMNHNLQFCLILRPYTIIIGCLNQEGIGSGRKIGIVGTMVVGINPILVDSFELVSILVLLRRYIAQGCKRDIDGILIMRQIEFCCMTQRFVQLVAPHLYRLSEEFYRGDCYRRSYLVNLDEIWVEAVETSCRTEIDSAVRSQESGVWHKLVAGESVIFIETLDRFTRRIFHNSLAGRNPHYSLRNDHTREILTRRIDGDTAEDTFRRQEFAESIASCSIELPLFADSQTVHLITHQRSRIILYMLILFPGIILTQAPQAASLGSKPYVALRIFLDIDGKRLERLDFSEFLLTFVKKTGSIHRSRPEPVLPVAINTISITSRSHSIGLENLLRSGSHIHSDDTITIGSHPQVITIGKERMNIILAHSRLARIRNKTVGLGIEAVKSGIIGSYPDAMLLVFEESSYHITAQSTLAG